MKINLKNNPMLLLCVGASLLGLPRTASADHPPIIKNGQKCQAASQCIGDDGCSWIANQYDYWFAMGECGTAGATPASVCIMPWTQCRITIFYLLGTACSGPSVTIETWQYGCNGVGKKEGEIIN